jgi:hypothetical protein
VQSKDYANISDVQINLSYAQLHLYLTAIFRKYDLYDGTGKETERTLKFFETSRDDVEIAVDFSDAIPRPESRGIRIVVR